MAINRLIHRRPLDSAAIDRFLERHGAPIVEDDRATFLWRGEADEVMVRHRVIGWADPLPLRRIHDTDLWYVTTELPRDRGWSTSSNWSAASTGSSTSTTRSTSGSRTGHSAPALCSRPRGTRCRTGAGPIRRPAQGDVVEQVLTSKALRREVHFRVYLPARFRTMVRYPLMIVHDGSDYLHYTAARTVLDNLIHRGEVAEMVVAFISPGNRLVEYANHAPHARFVARELTPYLLDTYPLVPTPQRAHTDGVELRRGGDGFHRGPLPRPVRIAVLGVGVLVFTDIGANHGGGPVFDPVVKFVNAYRARPRRIVERIFMTCGMYEP